MPKKEIDKMERTLETLEPTQEDFINRRINHISFAKTIYWLIVQSKRQEFIYSSELAKFMKITQTRAYVILRDLCQAGILYRKGVTSNLIEFHFLKNNEEPIVLHYLKKAEKTLGLN